MNNIVSMYETLKHVETFDDLVNVLSLKHGMPRRLKFAGSCVGSTMAQRIRWLRWFTLMRMSLIRG